MLHHLIYLLQSSDISFYDEIQKKAQAWSKFVLSCERVYLCNVIQKKSKPNMKKAMYIPIMILAKVCVRCSDLVTFDSPFCTGDIFDNVKHLYFGLVCS